MINIIQGHIRKAGVNIIFQDVFLICVRNESGLSFRQYFLLARDYKNNPSKRGTQVSMHNEVRRSSIQSLENMQITEENSDETKKSRKNVGPQTLPYHKLLSHADELDWILMALGTLGSVVHGFAQPVGYFLLGKALDAFGNNINDTDGMVKALEKVNKLT